MNNLFVVFITIYAVEYFKGFIKIFLFSSAICVKIKDFVEYFHIYGYNF